MIHRVVFGSMERFFGILIEHYAGAFPAWLAPVQVKLVAVSDKHAARCHELAGTLCEHGVRVEVNDTSGTVGNKIRKAIGEKIPYVLVIGDKEMGQTLAVRERGSEQTYDISQAEFIAAVTEKITQRQ